MVRGAASERTHAESKNVIQSRREELKKKLRGRTAALVSARSATVPQHVKNAARMNHGRIPDELLDPEMGGSLAGADSKRMKKQMRGMMTQMSDAQLDNMISVAGHNADQRSQMRSMVEHEKRRRRNTVKEVAQEKPASGVTGATSSEAAPPKYVPLVQRMVQPPTEQGTTPSAPTRRRRAFGAVQVAKPSLAQLHGAGAMPEETQDSITVHPSSKGSGVPAHVAVDLDLRLRRFAASYRVALETTPERVIPFTQNYIHRLGKEMENVVIAAEARQEVRPVRTVELLRLDKEWDAVPLPSADDSSRRPDVYRHILSELPALQPFLRWLQSLVRRPVPVDWLQDRMHDHRLACHRPSADVMLVYAVGRRNYPDWTILCPSDVTRALPQLCGVGKNTPEETNWTVEPDVVRKDWVVTLPSPAHTPAQFRLPFNIHTPSACVAIIRFT